jgi:hypothetical protein
MAAESMGATLQDYCPLPVQTEPSAVKGSTLLVDAGGAFASVMGRGHEARARRLALCWNACQEISDEDLAAIADGELALVDPEDLWDATWTIKEDPDARLDETDSQ